MHSGPVAEGIFGILSLLYLETQSRVCTVDERLQVACGSSVCCPSCVDLSAAYSRKEGTLQSV